VDPVRFLVLSDLHAYAGVRTDRSPSLLNFAHYPAEASRRFETCVEIVRQHGPISAILVAGDLSDWADEPALRQAWAQLTRMSAALDAPVLATAGNHDLDSRNLDNPLPNAALMRLKPPFPFGTRESRGTYFSEHHAVHLTQNYVTVSINSAAAHGYRFGGGEEHEHGRFTPDMVDWVRQSLVAAGPLPDVRILLTHHHLAQLPDIDLVEDARAHGSDEMLRMLSGFGDWIVVHGHKHRSWVQYASGGGDAPVLLSASTFSANLDDEMHPGFSERVDHQFHLLEIDHSTAAQDGAWTGGSRGRIFTWSYSGVDWFPSGGGDTLNGISGFGWRVSVSNLAARIRWALTSVREKVSDEWLRAMEPRIEYLTFDDMNRLLRELESGDPAVRHVLREDGTLSELFTDAAHVNPEANDGV